jgi:hypothetical protein
MQAVMEATANRRCVQIALPLTGEEKWRALREPISSGASLCQTAPQSHGDRMLRHVIEMLKRIAAHG